MSPQEIVFGVIALSGFAAFIGALAGVQIYSGVKG